MSPAALKNIPAATAAALGLAAVAAVALWWLSRKGNAASGGQAVGRTAVEGVAGVVVGAGQAVGIPATDASACARAMAEGRSWDASFACDAGTYIRYLFNQVPAPAPPAQPAREGGASGSW